MPGKGSQKRTHAVAKHAYVLRKQGMTNRQIAELVGRQVQQIPKLVALGERLSS